MILTKEAMFDKHIYSLLTTNWQFIDR